MQGNSGTLTYQSTSPAWGASGSQIRIDWNETYDITTNKSVVTFSNARLTVRGADGSTWITMLLKAGGENIINSDAFRGDFGGSVQAGVEKAFAPQGTWPRSVTVTHAADGTASLTVTASGIRVRNTGYDRNDRFGAASDTLTLTTIPMASSFVVSGTTIGSDMRFAISRASSSFTHKIYYKHEDGYYTLLAENVGTSYTWSIPEGVGAQIPTEMSGRFVLKVETYNGAAMMGEATKTVTLTIPNYSLTGSGWYSAGYSNTGTAASGIAKPVKGYSKLTYSATSSGVSTRYGAALGTPTVTVNGAAAQSGQILTSLSTAVVFRIADSRGKTLSATVTVTALDYSQPTVTNVSAKRCDAGGTDDDEGMFWYAKATASVSSLEGANTYTLTAAIKTAGGSYGAENALASGAKSVFGGTLSATTSYVVRITITDALGNSSQTEIQIPTMEVTFNAKNGGRGFAFGKTSETDYLLDVAWDERVRGNLTVDGTINGQTAAVMATIVAMFATAGEMLESGDDIHDFKSPGAYYAQDSTKAASIANVPYKSTGFKVFVIRGYLSNRIHHFFIANDYRIWHEYFNGTTWSSWYLIDQAAV